MMSPSISALKSYGPLFNLTLDIPEIYYYDLKSQKSFCYSSIADEVIETDKQYVGPTTVGIEFQLEQLGLLSIGKTLKEKELLVFERLAHELGIKIGLLISTDKAEFHESLSNNGDRTLKKELEKIDSRFKTIFYQSPLSIQICTNDGRTILVNPAWQELWGLSDEVIQNYILNDYNMLKDPLLEQHGVMEYIKRGYSGETTKIPVIRYDAKESALEGRERYVEGLIYPLKDTSGNVTEIVLIHIDVTDKKKLEQSQSILTNVSTVLSTSLEYDKTIAQIAEVCVPDFAEGCLIELCEGDRVNRVVTKHIDPNIQHSLFPSTNVLKTGIPELVTEIKNSAYSSYIAVPIIIRSKIIGAISFIMTSGKDSFTELNLETAIELAKRASYAIENSRLYQQLQQAIHLRDEFISLASHELKTPITSMKLQFQMFERGLKKDPDPLVKVTKMEKVIKSSNKQLGRINRLVDDMLDISRISSGKLYLHLGKCNLEDVVNNVIEHLTKEDETIKNKIKLSIEENTYAICDQTRIEQVLTNLLTNAIRYGEDSEIEVEIRCLKGNIVIKVSDHGPGIAPTDQQRVFGRFERATSINISGLGLGLYISRKIMEQHQGTLELESHLGKGAVFTASFPANLKLPNERSSK